MPSLLKDKISPVVFVEGAREWIGAPFLIGGRTKEGVDCASFLLETAKKLGVIPDFVPKPYGMRQLRDPAFLSSHLARFCDRVDVPKTGDVLVFMIGNLQCHCGLVAGDGYMIHVHRERGCVRERIEGRPKWKVVDVFRPRFYT